MTPAAERLPAPGDLLGSFDIDTLVAGAARLRGSRTAISDALGQTTWEAFDRRASGLAGLFQQFDLAPGECVLVIGGATTAACLALVAALRAGLDVALAPLHATAADLGLFALRTGAVAVLGEPQYGGISPAETCLAVAAAAPGLRLVCAIGTGEIDGAVTIDPALLEQEAPPSPRRGAPGRIMTMLPSGEVAAHEQRTLVASALDLVARARPGLNDAIVSTLAPVSMAGLVCGPLAAWLSGGSLHLVGPFEIDDFLNRIERLAPAYLVAPSALVPMLAQAGLLAGHALASLLAVSRQADMRPAPRIVADCALFDVYAMAEDAVLAEARDPNGNARDACVEPHYIALDQERILAAAWREGPDGPRLEGAAVSPQLTFSNKGRA